MLSLNFHPFPDLETDRLLLRAITMEDAETLFELRRDVDVMRFIDREPHQTVDDTRILIQKIINGIENNEAIAWAITLKEQPQLIGTISYHRIEKEHYRAEIGYMLHPKFWRRGIVGEAMKKVLGYGFQTMNLHSIEANVNPHNSASSSLLKKHGFVLEASFKENYFFNGKFIDTEIYSLLEEKSNL